MRRAPFALGLVAASLWLAAAVWDASRTSLGDLDASLGLRPRASFDARGLELRMRDAAGSELRIRIGELRREPGRIGIFSSPIFETLELRDVRVWRGGRLVAEVARVRPGARAGLPSELRTAFAGSEAELRQVLGDLSRLARREQL